MAMHRSMENVGSETKGGLEKNSHKGGLNTKGATSFKRGGWES